MIEANDEEVIELVESTLSEKNLSVLYFPGKRLEKKNLVDFINRLRKNFMGDIIDIQYSNHKPIQFITQANLLDYKIEKQKTFFFNNTSQIDLKSYLDEVTIVINGNFTDSEFTKQTWLCNKAHKNTDRHMPIELIKKIGESLKNTNVTTVNIIGTDITAHPDINSIISFFKTLPLKVEYIQNSYGCKCEYITSIILDVKSLNNSDNIFTEEQTYLFIVETDKDLIFLDTFIEKNQIKHYKIIPYFIGDNLDFFRKNVYVDKSDLEYEPQKMNDIYAKKFINLNSFGRLFITATGEVYSCLYEKPTSIFKGTFKDIIMQELCSDDSPWRNIRHEEPCCNCIYQWLCPSPSSYEKAIGKPNLCHIKP